MSLKHGLLGFLNYGQMTGYELNKAFKESLNFFWQAHGSQIYRELTKMEKDGWLTSMRVMQEDKPNKKMYAITDDGNKELMTWLRSHDANDGIYVRNVFLVKVFFSGEKTTKENIEMFKAYKQSCEKVLNMRSQMDRSIDSYKEDIPNAENSLYWMATAEYGGYYYRMCISWAEDMIKRLENM